MKASKSLSAALGALLATSATPALPQPTEAPAPTTRVLAIGTITPGADFAAVRAILPREVKETVKLYLAGKIDQWWSLGDRPGAVFIMNSSDLKATEELLETLPLGQAHLMRFELIPLTPLTPLRLPFTLKSDQP